MVLVLSLQFRHYFTSVPQYGKMYTSFVRSGKNACKIAYFTRTQPNLQVTGPLVELLSVMSICFVVVVVNIIKNSFVIDCSPSTIAHLLCCWNASIDSVRRLCD